jgi:hypothetical protein
MKIALSFVAASTAVTFVSSQVSLPNPSRPFISGGEDASVGEFPWFVSTLESSPFVCGGALIAPDIFATAGKKVYTDTLDFGVKSELTRLLLLSFLRLQLTARVLLKLVPSLAQTSLLQRARWMVGCLSISPSFLSTQIGIGLHPSRTT